MTNVTLVEEAVCRVNLCEPPLVEEAVCPGGRKRTGSLCTFPSVLL